MDVSRRAALSVELNAWLNGVDVEVIRGDLFGPLAGRRFDLIVSNPPYVPTPSDELPSSGPGRAWEAGQTGRVFIDRICSQVADHLTPAGRLLMVHSTVCGEQQSLAALSGQGLEAEVVWRHRGRLGPRLRERADWLRQNELLSDEDQDEVIVIRAVSRVPVGPVADRVGSM